MLNNYIAWSLLYTYLVNPSSKALCCFLHFFHSPSLKFRDGVWEKRRFTTDFTFFISICYTRNFIRWNWNYGVSEIKDYLLRKLLIFYFFRHMLLSLMLWKVSQVTVLTTWCRFTIVFARNYELCLFFVALIRT